MSWRSLTAGDRSPVPDLVLDKPEDTMDNDNQNGNRRH